ncbi:hypothetical protein ACFTWD_35320 [Streptomyces sp. NPDC056943]|uniref:hypothetical protein n=1 Tax=Streptomyces sp. NPDC056943 TaxID=3345971 RepID=UPI00363DF51F
MSHTQTHGGYRTDPLWAVFRVALVATGLGSAAALVGTLNADDECGRGWIDGPGAPTGTRFEAFPPSVVCEFERGEVSTTGDVLGGFLWVAMTVLVVCLFTALLAEWCEPRLGGPLVVPMSRTEKRGRTGAAFFVTGSAFLILYALTGWQLFLGPSSVCSGGDVRGPATTSYGFFPPQATCLTGSGSVSRLNPDWVTSLTTLSALPALVAGIGYALAVRRLRAERRTR